MRVQKIITLNFNNTQSTTAMVQVPFLVSNFHVHGISYNNEKATAGIHKYGYLTSNLPNTNQVLGMFYNDSTYPMSVNTDNSFEFKTPQVINGSYNFTISRPTWDAGNDEVLLLIEFVGDDKF